MDSSGVNKIDELNTFVNIYKKLLYDEIENKIEQRIQNIISTYHHVTQDKWTPISEIEFGLYLGGIPYPLSDFMYTQHESTHYTPHALNSQYKINVLISILEEEVYWNLDPNIEHTLIEVTDSTLSDLSVYFEGIADLIHRSKLSKKNIFMHCRMGISRSTTLLIAYYLKYGLPHSENSKRTLEEILSFIQTKRCYVAPNTAFLKQLIYYEQYLLYRHTNFSEPIKNEMMIESTPSVVV